MSKFKTRYAPSNTGGATCGSTRTALYAYALARTNGGTFTVRIEDSDKARSTKESLLDILNCLKWLGITWDNDLKIEDIEKDIYKKEFFQSQQGDIYDKYVDQLLQENKAYEKDGCVFFRMPKKDYILNDLILGEVKFPADSQEDFIIRRKDGTHIFHLVNVVSDLIEGMTHLVKGSDHVSNFPKHAALFEAFGAKLPQYAHLSLVLDAQGAKLSKRRKDQNCLLSDLHRDGYLPQVIVNMLGLLGWSNPDSLEVFDLDYMCKKFDIKNCGKANPRYDVKKLLKMNSDAISKLSPEDFAKTMYIYGMTYYPDIVVQLGNDGKWKKFLELYHSRAKTLKDPFENCKWLINTNVELSEDAKKVVSLATGVLQLTFSELIHNNDWTKASIMASIDKVVKEHGLSMNKVSQPVRASVVGNLVSPPIDGVLEILGKEKSLMRIESVIDKFMPQALGVHNGDIMSTN